MQPFATEIKRARITNYNDAVQHVYTMSDDKHGGNTFQKATKPNIGEMVVATTQKAREEARTCSKCDRKGHTALDCRQETKIIKKLGTSPVTATSKLTCDKCKRRGHLAKDCYTKKLPAIESKYFSQDLNKKWCTVCKNDTHSVRDCRVRRTGSNVKEERCPLPNHGGHLKKDCRVRTQPQPYNKVNTSALTRPVEQRECNYCGKMGHYANTCRIKQAATTGGPREQKPSGNPVAAKRPVDKSKVTCYNCNKQGHYAMECTAPKKVNLIFQVDENGCPLEHAECGVDNKIVTNILNVDTKLVVDTGSEDNFINLPTWLAIVAACPELKNVRDETTTKYGMADESSGFEDFGTIDLPITFELTNGATRTEWMEMHIAPRGNAEILGNKTLKDMQASLQYGENGKTLLTFPNEEVVSATY